MPVTRREFLKAGMASGALLVARPLRTLAGTLGPAEVAGAARTSRLFPGTTLVHADLHNHSLFSDGDGDPAKSFASMRSAGLDVAALTDHSTVSYGLPGDVCGDVGCDLLGINEVSWAKTKELADAVTETDTFVALRGFEWSSPTLGHINVWFSERWTDPLHTAGTSTGEGLAQFLHENAPGADAIDKELDALVRQAPTTGAGMALFYEWLRASVDRPGAGGGLDGIAGFNHPGREPGRFSHFKLEPSVRDRIVSLELFNRREDYLYEGTESGYPSPLNECLNAGWRVGLLGVTDEHGTDWGIPEGKGRGGVWVNDLSRNGVREAMVARRFFGTRLRGLRVDAAANGVRMGGGVPHRSGPVRFALDIDKGPDWWGRPLNVQVLRPGSLMPTITEAIDVRVPVSEGDSQEPVISFEVPLDVADGSWAVLRITDPSEPPDGRADATYRAFGNAIAYTSPFFLDPNAP